MYFLSVRLIVIFNCRSSIMTQWWLLFTLNTKITKLFSPKKKICIVLLKLDKCFSDFPLSSVLFLYAYIFISYNTHLLKSLMIPCLKVKIQNLLCENFGLLIYISQCFLVSAPARLVLNSSWRHTLTHLWLDFVSYSFPVSKIP